MVKEDECGEFDATMDSPLYELKAKIAELYIEGGYELEKDASYAGLSLHSAYFNFKLLFIIWL